MKSHGDQQWRAAFIWLFPKLLKKDKLINNCQPCQIKSKSLWIFNRTADRKTGREEGRGYIHIVHMPSGHMCTYPVWNCTISPQRWREKRVRNKASVNGIFLCSLKVWMSVLSLCTRSHTAQLVLHLSAVTLRDISNLISAALSKKSIYT